MEGAGGQQLGGRGGQVPPPLPVRTLNHISRACSNVSKSLAFYRDILGFVPIKRPDAAFDFDGAWLFNYGIGIHLIKGNDRTLMPRSPEIDPLNDHLSFQSDSIDSLASALERHGLPYKRQVVVEGPVRVHQLFFHDPDNNMIEICNCEALPITPLTSCPISFSQRSCSQQRMDLLEVMEESGKPSSALQDSKSPGLSQSELMSPTMRVSAHHAY
eukprot:jgi/Chlat1/8873/Chrsp92S08189